MKSVTLVFLVHQPVRLKRYRFFDIGTHHDYYDDYANETLIRQLAAQCYLPANSLLLRQINRLNGQLKVAFAIPGVTLELFEQYAPEVTDSFILLAETGNVEFLGGTYSHSLSSVADPASFASEAEHQRQAISRLSGQQPEVFLNTEMIYSDTIGAMVADMGYKGMITEGARHILGWKSPDFLYCNAINPRLKVMMRHSKLSDDLSIRFSDNSWAGYPLTADKYLGWIRGSEPAGESITICVDYGTFGNVHPAKSGIFNFLDHFIFLVTQSQDVFFSSPREVIARLQPVSLINVKHPVSLAGEERDLSFWNGNDIQGEALAKLYELALPMNHNVDPDILKDWHYLQASDHFLFMSTKAAPQPLHNRYSPYNSPFEAFINYMNILNDFSLRMDENPLKPDCFEELENCRRFLKEKEQEIEEFREEIRRLKRHKRLPRSGG